MTLGLPNNYTRTYRKLHVNAYNKDKRAPVTRRAFSRFRPFFAFGSTFLVSNPPLLPSSVVPHLMPGTMFVDRHRNES